LFVLFFLFVGAGWGAALAGLAWLLQDSKKTIETLETYIPEANSRVYDAKGEILGELTSGKEHRQLVGLNQVPLYMQKAIVATEDNTFYEHRGVSLFAFLNIVRYKLTTGRTRGASTITMQVARLVEPLEVGRERTTARKLREVLTSLRIEQQFTKDEILELYLNLTFFGGRASGVQAAAQQYFARDCWDLTLGECAMLASLPRSPNTINPFKNMASARQHRDIVLGQMLENRFISQEEYDAAIREDLDEQVITPEERKQLAAEGKGLWQANKFKAPYFVEEVRQRLLTEEGKSDVFGEGLEIHTTLDMRLQRAAEEILLKALDAFDEKKRAALKRAGQEDDFVPVSGALVCIDNRPGCQGYVRAMVGGRDFDKEKYNTATQARRQPGSSIKPFVWTVAIMNGMTPSSIMVDEPFVRTDPWGNTWAPKNFDGEFQGPVTLRTALQKSINVISAKLTERFTMPAVRSVLQRAGIRTPIENAVGLTIALGSTEVTVLDHCVAYSTLANGGVRYDPVLITEVKNRDGLTLYDGRRRATREQVIDPNVAYVMVHMMKGVCQFGTGANTQAQWEKAEPGRPRAGKTGTSNRSRNAWFCGFTTDYTCVVWIGYRDNRSLGEGKEFTGGRLANPVWTDFMIVAEEGLPARDFEKPNGVVFYNVDRNTGLAGGTFQEAFVRGTQPPQEMIIPDDRPGLGQTDTRLLELF